MGACLRIDQDQVPDMEGDVLGKGPVLVTGRSGDAASPSKK